MWHHGCAWENGQDRDKGVTFMITNAQTLGPIISLMQDYRGYFEDILASFFYIGNLFFAVSIDHTKKAFP